MATSPTTRQGVLVLGAGLTGLSTALTLRERGASCRVLEQADRPGGHAVTIDDEGFRFDRTGHLLHLRDPATRDRVLDLLGGDVEIVQRKSRVYSHGVYTRYPFQANTFGLPPQVAFECLKGFVEAHHARHEGEPGDFEAYCLRHFGEGISKHFMIPYNQKLWGVPAREITAAWCQRFVPRPTLDDVLAGAVGCNDRELGYNASFIYPRRGIGALPEAMARALPPIDLATTPVAVDPVCKLVHTPTASFAYETLVSTIPLDTLGRLLTTAPDPARAAFARLRCTSLYYLDVALDEPPPQPFHWVYVPEPRFAFYRVGCYSAFSPHLAPAGKASLYVELADRSAPDMTTLGPQLARDLAEMRLVTSPSSIRFMRLRHLRHAYVIHDHAHQRATDDITAFLDEHQIISTGRYGGWNYSSMEDALHFGRAAAERALARA